MHNKLISNYDFFYTKMSIDVVHRASDNVKEFNTKEEFINYYETHKSEIDKQSTCILNKKFKINNFHLGREKGKLKLIPLNLYRPSEYQVNHDNNLINIKIDAINEQVIALNQKIDTLTEVINGVLRHLINSN